ncbi:MAG: ABC-F type ribosomal protection protein [Oscillospiraceae bacterium]|nr:ABC-F type ribosomal protection protein [Oscillospiraceae bacterium]
MSIIKIQNLSFGYDSSYENVFENVNLQLDTAWRLGLTGRNGRGKTTLLKILMGELEYGGKIISSVDFEYFPYAPKDSYFTADVIHNIAPQAEDWQIRRELGLLEADEVLLYRPFDSLSNGEQTKILIIGMFLRENSFLLIDEPTNHLDTHAREVLADYLKKKSGFILVSHDRDFLDSCIDHILVINKTNIEVQKGSFSSWNENRERQEQFEQTKNENLKKEIRKLEQTAKKVKAHSEKIASEKIGFDPVKVEKSVGRRVSVAKKSAKLMNRAKSMEHRIERNILEKNQLLQNVEEIPALKLSPLKYHSSQLLSFQNVSLCYEDEAVFKDISFHVKQGERIAICGQNGCGKTSLIKLVLGEIEAYQGEITRGSRLKISYVCQSADSLCGTLDDYIEQYQVNESLFKAILRKLDFSRELFLRPIESYSQGQKKKVMLARSLSEQAHLYIWDEPLNYIDVLSRIQIEELLKTCDVTLLFVEHDKHFCEQVATKQILL